MAYTAETAQVRAAQLKEGLAWSQNLIKECNSALDSYSGHLTDLKMAVAGVAQRTQVSKALRSPPFALMHRKLWLQHPKAEGACPS